MILLIIYSISDNMYSMVINYSIFSQFGKQNKFISHLNFILKFVKEFDFLCQKEKKKFKESVHILIWDLNVR